MPVSTTKEVNNLEDLKDAIAKTYIKTVNLNKDIENVRELLAFTQPITLNGNSHKISFTITGQNLVFLQPSTINDLTVESQGTEEWTSTYATQVYNADGFEINNSKFTGANGGLLINGATATINNVDVSGNTFGGIEVSKGPEASKASSLTISGTLINTTEAYGKPTVWIDGKDDGNTVTGGSLFSSDTIKDDQIQYYLNEENMTE